MRAVSTVILALAGSLALSACGQKVELKPKPGEPMPVAPYGRADSPSADALLKLPPQVAPERHDELRKRSEPRGDDPFELPPKD